MKYIKDMVDGSRINGVYLCKSKNSAMTKNGKSYENVVLMDKTATLDAKVWEPDSPAIEEYDSGDFIEVTGEVILYNGSKQAKISRIRKSNNYILADYIPTSQRDIEEMYGQVLAYVESVKNSYLKKLLQMLFVEDEELVQKFKATSAAKTVHHGFMGGLLEHTLGVTNLCDYYAKAYPILKRDLLITAALCHDIGKVQEFSAFPQNDYTDAGQLLGHIVIGSEMLGERIRNIPDFPVKLANELKHCIIAHHGELEYGSPKKPALIEAVALNFADNTDAKMQTLKEVFEATDNKDWLGYNKFLESNIRKTSDL